MARIVKEILNQFLQQQNDWRSSLLNSWPTLVGLLARYVRIEKITNDTLILGVMDPHWMHEIYNLQSTILYKINNHIKPYSLKFIHCVLVKRNKDQRTKKNTQGLTCSISAHRLTAKEKMALQSLSDIELQEALKNFLWRTQGE